MLRQPGLSKIVYGLAFLRILLKEIVKGCPGLIELALLCQHMGQTRDRFDAPRPYFKGCLISLASFRKEIIIGQQVTLRVGVV
jgi:hypothetical protein